MNVNLNISDPFVILYDFLARKIILFNEIKIFCPNFSCISKIFIRELKIQKMSVFASKCPSIIFYHWSRIDSRLCKPNVLLDEKRIFRYMYVYKTKRYKGPKLNIAGTLKLHIYLLVMFKKKCHGQDFSQSSHNYTPVF